MATKLLLATAATIIGLANLATSHSQMTNPQSTSSSTCRMGHGVSCPGPCEFSKFTGAHANRPSAWFYPPERNADTFRRGQSVQIKYTRNNHGPGGFVRMSLVPIAQMRDKAVHAANAFHYSCWGAHTVIASGDDLKSPDQYGFSMVGTDGQHGHPKGYYKLDIVIPDVVPDGKYMLAWSWFGGVNGNIEATPQEPETEGKFADYWSCSFVLIQGGAPLADSYTPIFVNDMPQWSSAGCMSHADDVGQCTVEPCGHREGTYCKPAAFLGDGPKPITPENFGGAIPDEPTKEIPPNEAPKKIPAPETDAPVPTPDIRPPTDPGKVLVDRGVMSCLCIAGSSDMCFKEIAAYSEQCVAHRNYFHQPKACNEACCGLCKRDDSFAACANSRIRRVCSS